MNAAAKGGHLHIFDWMLTDHQDGRGPWRSDFSDAADEAAAHGHLELLTYLHTKQIDRVSDFAIEDAVQGGHHHILQWFLNTFPDRQSSDFMNGAASLGQLITQCSDESQARSTLTTCSIFEPVRAAEEGNLEKVKWVHEHFSGMFTPKVMDEAAIHGHLDIVRWLHENRSEGCSTEAMDIAALEGYLDVLIYLHENRTEGCTSKAMYYAAWYGHLDIVKWLRQHRTEEWTNAAMRDAALDGHAAVVAYLHDTNANRFYGVALREAAIQGHMEMINVLIAKHGLKFGSGIGNGLYYASTIEKCATKMLTEIRTRDDDERQWRSEPKEVLHKIQAWMEWFHTQGSPVHAHCVVTLFKSALEAGYPCLIRSFFENKSSTEYSEYIAAAYPHFDRDVMRWLIEHGPQIDTPTALHLFKMYGKVRDVELMRWLTEQGRALVAREALHDQLGDWEKLVTWVFEHTKFENSATRRFIRDAVESAPQENVEWLAANISDTDTREWLGFTQ